MKESNVLEKMLSEMLFKWVKMQRLFWQNVSEDNICQARSQDFISGGRENCLQGTKIIKRHKKQKSNNILRHIFGAKSVFSYKNRSKFCIFGLKFDEKNPHFSLKTPQANFWCKNRRFY